MRNIADPRWPRQHFPGITMIALGTGHEMGTVADPVRLTDLPLSSGQTSSVPDLWASEPVTLAESLMAEARWSPANFGDAGPNPPYLRIGGKLWVTLTEFEPCFSSFHRDRVLFRSKVSMADHLSRYDQIMVDPLAFEECFGPLEGTDATFPFGVWLAIREVRFTGIELLGKRHGPVVLPLEPLAVASAVWLRNTRRPGRPPA
jgi:hypothetical protein